MVQPIPPPQLAALLRHPSLWRGRGSVAQATQPTGFAALDAALPGGGWPRRGLVEILTATPGQGELTLWVPLTGGGWWCVAQVRPLTAPTSRPEDLVGVEVDGAAVEPFEVAHRDEQ